MNRKRLLKIAAVFFGGILSLVVLVMGFTVIQNGISRASDQVPQDVTVSDITENSAKINWTTGIKNQGVVEYGTSPTTLNSFGPETSGQTNHQIALTLLSSNTSYYFDVNIGGKKYDNGGVPWTFSTKGPGGTNPSLLLSPSPVSTIRVENIPNTCTYTDCDTIKTKLGQGCSTQDYFRCLAKLSPTASTSGH